MPVYFDSTHLGKPVEAYVAWVDVMGIQGALRRSIEIAANFVYKMHDAALQANRGGLRVYPVMDGAFVCAADGATMETFLRRFFREAAAEFVKQPQSWHRFVVKGAVAKGEVFHGADLGPNACHRLRDHPEYRDSILLGTPMVAAHLGEVEAPPFGLFVDATASHFSSAEPFPFDLWWRWYEGADSALVSGLKAALTDYYDWAVQESANIAYPVSRIRLHRGQAQLYLGG